MSEIDTSADQTPDESAPESDTPEVFDKAYVDKLRAESAKYRTKARDNATAAEELASLKASTEQTIEDLTSRATAAERERDALRISIKHGVTSDDDLALISAQPDEESMEKLATRLAAASAGTLNVPRQGLGSGAAKPDPRREFARQLFGRDS